MKITLKKVLPWAAAFVAYRLYKMYEVGQSFQWYVSKVYPTRLGTNDFAITTEYELYNPTGTKFYVRGIQGEIYYKGTMIGTFNGGGFEFQSGRFKYPVVFRIPNKTIITALSQIVSKNEFPVFDVKMTTYLPLFKTTETMKINTEDYAKEWSSKLLNLWK
jgi:hypothetical protein